MLGLAGSGVQNIKATIRMRGELEEMTRVGSVQIGQEFRAGIVRPAAFF